MEKKIFSYLNRYAKTFRTRDEDGTVWYNDCDMVDSAMSDLNLSEDTRAEVNRLVDLWIQEKG